MMTRQYYDLYERSGERSTILHGDHPRSAHPSTCQARFEPPPRRSGALAPPGSVFTATAAISPHFETHKLIHTWKPQNFASARPNHMGRMSTSLEHTHVCYGGTTRTPCTACCFASRGPDSRGTLPGPSHVVPKPHEEEVRRRIEVEQLAGMLIPVVLAIRCSCSLHMPDEERFKLDGTSNRTTLVNVFANDQIRPKSVALPGRGKKISQIMANLERCSSHLKASLDSRA